MSANTQVTTGISGASIDAHIAAKLLMLAQKTLIFHQLSEKAQLPSGEGKTFQFNRYERLDLPLNPLSEAVDPDGSSMELTTVSATADQWGAFISLSDVRVLTFKHPQLQVAMNLLSYQAAELVERENINLLLTGTSVSFGGTATTRAGLSTASTDSFSDNVAQRVVKRLRDRGAHEDESGYFVGVVDSAMEQDISSSSTSTFVQAAAYSSIRTLYKGEIGEWRGVRWMRSNFIPSLEGVEAVSATSPDDPAGTFTTANYRVSVAYYNKRTGFLEKLSQNDNVAFTDDDSLALTTPNDSSYVYKVFVSLAAGAATAIMYQANAATYALGFIPHNTAVSVLAPPTSGASIAGSDIPAEDKIVHFGWVFGKESYCNVDLQNMQVFVSGKDATTDNPIMLRRTVGWKCMFKPVIQNNDFMERIEVLSQFD
jgi:N4-gp56 family major capsid protein